MLERVLTRTAKETRTHWRNIDIVLGQGLCSLPRTNLKMQLLPFLDWKMDSEFMCVFFVANFEYEEARHMEPQVGQACYSKEAIGLIKVHSRSSLME